MKSYKWFHQEKSIVTIKTRTICEGEKLIKSGVEYLETKDFLLPIEKKSTWPQKILFWIINIVALVSGLWSIFNYMTI